MPRRTPSCEPDFPERARVLRAADALYGTRDPRAQGTGPSRALVSLNRPEEVRPPLLAAAGDLVWRLRMLAAHALRSEPGAEEELLALTCNPYWRVRDAACRSLGRHLSSEAGLLAALGDEDARVAGAAECAPHRSLVKEPGAERPRGRGVS